MAKQISGKRRNSKSKHTGKTVINDLLSDELAPLFHEAARTDSASAWFGHIPFAHWVVRQIRPAIIVELGTHAGVSYSAFCSAVLREDLETQCFAVDTWKGDDHAGHYNNAIHDEFSHFNSEHYGSFSTLLRKTFDEALDDIDDNSIDLLHIDGFHSYDAVQHDFVTWAPKLSDRAVVLFHDTNERREGFGVWRYWAELREQYPAFEFAHSHGLGVLCVGSKSSDALAALCTLNDAQADRVRERFEAAGDRWVQRAGQRRMQSTVKQLRADTERLQTELTDQMAVASQLVKNATAAALAAKRQGTKQAQQTTDELEQVRKAKTALESRNDDLQTKLKLAKEEIEDVKRRLTSEQNHAAELPSEKKHLLNPVSSWMTAPIRAVTNLADTRSGWTPRTLIQRSVNPKEAAIRRQLQREIKALTASPLFDRDWYLATYPDVGAASMDPLHHYCEFGWHEGRDPCLEFSTKNYLVSNPDVSMAQINPLLHYHEHGQYEARPGLLQRSEIENVAYLDSKSNRVSKTDPRKDLFSEKLKKNIQLKNIHKMNFIINEYYTSFKDKPTQILIVECYCALKQKNWSKAKKILNFIYMQKSQSDLYFEPLSNEILRVKSPNENFFQDLNEVKIIPKNKLCVYTTIFGAYDTLMPILTKSNIVNNFICFTDQDLPDVGWNLIKCPNRHNDPNLNAKEYKIKPHDHLHEYEYSLFVDGNTILHGRIDEIIERYLAQSNFSMWRHPERSDIMIELIAIAAGRRHEPETILGQLKKYVEAGFSCDNGITEGNFIWRKHHDSEIRALMESWWQEIMNETKRDQISLPFVSWKHHKRPDVIPNQFGSSRSNCYTSKVSHRPALEKALPRTKSDVIFLGWPGFETSGSTLMRGNQLSGICAQELSQRNIKFKIYDPHDRIRQNILFLTKNFIQNTSVQLLEELKQQQNYILMDFVDLDVDLEKLNFCDVLIASSLESYSAYMSSFPKLRVCHLTHHVDPRIGGGNQATKFSSGYFGELENTHNSENISSLVHFTKVSTFEASSEWLQFIGNYNFHYAIRKKRSIDGYKPFLKGFTAAHCNANILIQEDANDALSYLGNSYPYLLKSGASEEDVLNMLEFAKASYLGPRWREGLDVMREIGERSSKKVIACEFRRILNS